MDYAIGGPANYGGKTCNSIHKEIIKLLMRQSQEELIQQQQNLWVQVSKYLFDRLLQLEHTSMSQIGPGQDNMLFPLTPGGYNGVMRLCNMF